MTEYSERQLERIANSLEDLAGTQQALLELLQRQDRNENPTIANA